MGRIVTVVLVVVLAVLVYNWVNKPMVIYWDEKVDYYGMTSKRMECSWTEGDKYAICDGKKYVLSLSRAEWLDQELVKARK